MVPERVQEGAVRSWGGPTLLSQGDALLSLGPLGEARSLGQLGEALLSLQEPGGGAGGVRQALVLQSGGLSALGEGGGVRRALGEGAVLEVSELGLL